MMVFPSFGDADKFNQLAEDCAASIGQPDVEFLSGCYNAVRPMGASLYYAAGHLLGLDKVEYAYFYLSLNILWITIIAFVLSGAAESSNHFIEKINSRMILFVALLMTGFMFAGHVPVMLTDLVGLAVLMVGFWLLMSLKERLSFSNYFLFGLLVALATYVKQTYIVMGALIFISDSVMSFISGTNKMTILLIIKRGLICCAGVSFIFGQIFMVYLNSGDIWLYELSSMKAYEVSNNLPYYELVAYSIPIKSAYLAGVSNEISNITYWVLKLYKGMMQFDVPVYIGSYADSSPEWSVIDNLSVLKMYSFFLFYAVVSIIVTICNRNMLGVLVLAGLFFSIFTAIQVHTEIRYYTFSRLVFFFACIYTIIKWCSVFIRTRRMVVFDS